MGTTLRLVDGDLSVTLRPSQPSFSDPIFVQSYDLGFPDIREVKQDSTGQSGTLDLTEFHGAKTITVEATVVDDLTMTRHEWLDVLKILCHPARRPYMYVQCDGWASERRMVLRANRLSCVIDKTGGVAIKTSLAWTVPTGLLEAVEVDETRMRVVGAAIGGTFPVSFEPTGVSFTPSNSATVNEIVNEGTATTPPLYRIYGGCTGPQVSNGTTGEVMSFPDMSVPAGHYVEVDVANRTVYLDGNPALNYYRFIDWTVSTWWELKPGLTLISLSTASQDSDCELLIRHRPRWL